MSLATALALPTAITKASGVPGLGFGKCAMSVIRPMKWIRKTSVRARVQRIGAKTLRLSVTGGTTTNAGIAASHG